MVWTAMTNFIKSRPNDFDNFAKEADLKVNFLKDERDIFCWKFSNKGYFNFKSNIPKIIASFKLS